MAQIAGASNLLPNYNLIGNQFVPEILPFGRGYISSLLESQNPIRFVSAIHISDEAVNEFRRKTTEYYENIKIVSAISVANDFTRKFTSTMQEYHKSKILPAAS